METEPPYEPLEEVADYIFMLGPCEQWWINTGQEDILRFGWEALGKDF